MVLELQLKVDMTHGFIRLKQTKNGKALALPFNETLWTLFSRLRTRQDVPWVFHDVGGHRWNDIRYPFDAACEGAGLKDFRFHDLRHAHLSPKHLTSAVRVLDAQEYSSLDNAAQTDARRRVSRCVT